MAGLLMAVISVAAAFWMYLDASKYGIGKDPDNANLWRLSAGGWATWGIVFWPLGLPIYLLRRASMIQKARQHPVLPKNRFRSLVILGLASLLLIGFNLSAAGANGGSGWAASKDIFLDRWNGQVASPYKIEGFNKDRMGKDTGEFLGGKIYALGDMYMLSTFDQSMYGSLCAQTVEAALGITSTEAEALSRQAYSSLRSSDMAYGMVEYHGYTVAMGIMGASELTCTVNPSR